VLSAHWAAAKSQQLSVFWPGPAVGAINSPTNERRQTHQVRFRIRIRAETEFRAPVIDEVEFDITPALHEKLFPRLVIERGRLPAGNECWIDA